MVVLRARKACEGAMGLGQELLLLMKKGKSLLAGRPADWTACKLKRVPPSPGAHPQTQPVQADLSLAAHSDGPPLHNAADGGPEVPLAIEPHQL